MEERPEGRTREQVRSWQDRRGWEQGGGWRAQNSWSGFKARRWHSDRRSWVQRGGYGGFFIPTNVFSLHFGPQRWFRINTLPVIYAGYPRFQYGGYSFIMVDPWPEYWPDNWYATDNVYVDYDNGYYLYNARDPGVRIALSVVM